MSKNMMKYSRKNFIILPIAFFILSYLLLFVTLSPVMSPFIGIADMFFADQKLDYNKEYNNIFVPG